MLGTSLNLGVDHNMDRKPWAKALRLISRNALAYGLARLMIDAVNHFVGRGNLEKAHVRRTLVVPIGCVVFERPIWAKR